MYSQLTYSELIDLLNTLGFEMMSVRGSHRVFKHPAIDDLVIVLPYRSENDLVKPVYIKTVEKTLDEAEILSKEEFQKSILSMHK